MSINHHASELTISIFNGDKARLDMRGNTALRAPPLLSKINDMAALSGAPTPSRPRRRAREKRMRLALGVLLFRAIIKEFSRLRLRHL